MLSIEHAIPPVRHFSLIKDTATNFLQTGLNQPNIMVADGMAAFSLVGSFLGWMPDLAAMGAAIYYLLQIWLSIRAIRSSGKH